MRVSGLLLLLFLFAISAFENSSSIVNVEVKNDYNNVNTKSIEIDHYKRTIIYGNGEAISIESIIELNSVSYPSQNIVIQQAPGTVIEGQTLVGVNITLIDSPNSIIRDNTITTVSGNIGYGIYIVNSNDTVIQNNVISDISGIVDAYGIYIQDSYNMVIEHNDIFLVSSPISDGETMGIRSWGSGNATVIGNSIHELSGNYVSAIDLRLNSGLQNIIFSNSINDLSGIELRGVFSFGTNTGIVESNTVTLLVTTPSGVSAHGIVLAGENFVILNNVVDDLRVNGANNLEAYGIFNSGSNFVAGNNSVSNIQATSTTGNVNVYGIYTELSNSPATLLTENQVNNVFGTATAAAAEAFVFGLYFWSSSIFTAEFNKITNIVATAPNAVVQSEIFLLESDLANFNFVEGSTYPIVWSHDELLNHNQYYLYLDNEYIDAKPWVDGNRYGSTKIAIDTQLPVGVYENSILIVDTVTGTIPVTDTVTVTIVPVFVPELVNVIPPSSELGIPDNNIIWEFVDNNPSYYELFTDISLSVNSTWESGEPILYNVENLGAGIYNFTIIVYDLDGNSANDTLWVTLADTLIPEVLVVSESVYEQEVDTSNITWNLIDLYPDYFWVYANGSEVLNGTWENQVPVVFDLYGWDLGLTNFTLEAVDQYGNTGISTIWVTLVDNIEPFLSEPFDIFLDEGDTGVTLEWIAEDFNPRNWTMIENEVWYQNGTWESGEPISFNLDEYKLGKYNFTIFVSDQFGNTVADTVFVSVFLPEDHTYTRNTETKTTQDQNIFQDIDPVYIAAGAGGIGIITIGSILRRRRGF